MSLLTNSHDNEDVEDNARYDKNCYNTDYRVLHISSQHVLVP